MILFHECFFVFQDWIWRGVYDVEGVLVSFYSLKWWKWLKWFSAWCVWKVVAIEKKIDLVCNPVCHRFKSLPHDIWWCKCLLSSLIQNFWSCCSLFSGILFFFCVSVRLMLNLNLYLYSFPLWKKKRDAFKSEKQ